MHANCVRVCDDSMKSLIDIFVCAHMTNKLYHVLYMLYAT